jgi:ribonuclease HI
MIGKQVRIVTDGACVGNPGPGGWAAILRWGPHARGMWGWEPYATNNRMELRAAIEGLRALRERCQVELVTDSQYLRNGITSWIQRWKRNGWMTAAKQPVMNRDLWMDLDELSGRHLVTWVWTKGHASHQDNNLCDELASSAARQRSSGSKYFRGGGPGGAHRARGGEAGES